VQLHVVRRQHLDDARPLVEPPHALEQDAAGHDRLVQLVLRRHEGVELLVALAEAEAPVGPQEQPEHRLLDVLAHRFVQRVGADRAAGDHHVAERHVAVHLRLDRRLQLRLRHQAANQAQAAEVARHRIVGAVGGDRAVGEAQVALFELQRHRQRPRAAGVAHPLQKIGERHGRKCSGERHQSSSSSLISALSELRPSRSSVR
jgi:hypothetical protein